MLGVPHELEDEFYLVFSYKQMPLEDDYKWLEPKGCSNMPK
jgi:hypothetical protein